MTETIQMRTTGRGAAEVLLYGDIGRPQGGITALAFAEKLKGLPRQTETINLRLHSEGGDLFTAFAIYNMLWRHPARVEVDVDGVALSSGSLVMMSGDTIRMPTDGQVMVHSPWTFAMGTAAELRQRADRLDAMMKSVVSIYAKRTKQTDAEITALMQAETWMDGPEALRLGFVDELAGPARMAAHVDRDRYKHPPASLLSAPKLPPGLVAYKERVRKQTAPV
jgi:ATP-dependent protease ClpP protease subunit